MHASVGTNPPQIILPATPAVVADDEFPKAIFGKVPPGFTLERQHVAMLVFWHRKACAAIAALPDNADDETFSAAGDVARRLFAAIKTAKPNNAREVACMVAEIATQAKACSVEDALSIDDLLHLSKVLDDVVAPIRPAKHPGMLKRGQRLTRAGLLHRYVNLMMSEIQTISWHLYGKRDYLFQFSMHSASVEVRVRRRSARGHRYPFNDESGLAERARKVLKSLNIDFTHDDDMPPRTRKGGKR